ncbi:hypothetical protein [Methylobacterium sp. 37f]|uniref:hypothetical protein n=1 Tax=Methylobacterium sp. 37f TaxID=2817058 RepID=UPI001FFD952C|nr:hypothetical protein [Methylobacterium sp. 37f]MCK2055312.1 hypothetical protein [Methylobacterium sp. 37f]
MAWRNVRPYPSNYAFGNALRPAEGWPTRRVWISRFNHDHLRLRAHPVWQLASRLDPNFRAYAEDPEHNFVAWDMADAPDQPPFAVYYGFGRPVPVRMLVARGPDVRKGETDLVVGLMGDRVFLERRETQAFSYTIDILANRDPFRFVPLPVPQDIGEYDAGDLESLGDLAR